ncbi:MAG: carbamoyltransferase HypF [Cyanobium sp.]
MRGADGQEARLQVTCRGVVQGLGVRPSLQRLATQLGLRGHLSNTFGAVQIDLAGSREALEAWLRALPAALPAGRPWELVGLRWMEAPGPPWPDGVELASAGVVPLGRTLFAPGLSADRAPCARCLAELAERTSRRYRYPFISCCDCGPRFSLATALPFCRAHTTLASFPTCSACAREFRTPGDRRFHAETISCPSCGPRLGLLDGGGQERAGSESALAEAAKLLLAGQIVALQGVGGFQLLVDATSRSAVERLRERKRRPSKPFALLVAHPCDLEAWVRCSPEEEEALRHPAAPIVLLPRWDASRLAPDQDPWAAVAPGSPALGVMLPASGLHHLLVELVGRPLVATSGNRGGEPLCIAPAEAVERLAGIADAFLVHDLPIARPLDDSLLQVIDGRLALLRRARGFVPEPLPWQGPLGSEVPSPASTAGGLLAMGGDLKAAPALVLGDRIWLAPHLGDLADAAVQQRWQGALEDQLPGGWAPITRLACDAHPGYVSHQLLRPLALRHGLAVSTVPHHLAHGLAVGAEHGLQPPFLVVACDGLGLADPEPLEGQERLWGGELLWVKGVTKGQVCWERLGALRSFPLPGGERASREPRRCALGLLAAAGPWALNHPAAAPVLEAFSPQERRLLLQTLAQGSQAPPTSSLGRLLDGLVSLLGLAQILSYEGEGGLRWQGAAARGQARMEALGVLPTPWPFPLEPSPPGDPCPLPLGRWDWEPLVAALLADRASGGDAAPAAWKLQRAIVAGLVEGTCTAAAWTGCRRVALAGGCFQNRSLLEGCLQALRQRGLTPQWNERVPCSDGGLALGQAWAVQASGSGL